MSTSPYWERRQRALSEYLVTGAPTEHETGPRIPPRLESGARGLALDEWETSVLEQALAGSTGNGSHWSSLLLQGVALETKYLDEIGQLNSGDRLPDIVEQELQRRLVTDAAVGLALLEEAQEAINQMVLEGQVSYAKKLTHFRNKLGEHVGRIAESIGHEALTEAQTLSREMSAVPGNDAESPTPEPANEAEHLTEDRSTDQTVVAATARTDDERRRLLGVELLRLQQPVDADGATLETNPGVNRLRLSPWELRTLESALRPHHPDDSTLVAECVALTARIAEREEASADDGEETSIDDQITTVAIGLALLDELQFEINATIAAGKADVARQLSGFRNKFGQCVTPLRESLGGDAFGQATQQAARLTVPRASRGLPPAPDDRSPAATTRDRRTAKPCRSPQAHRYVAAEQPVSQVKSLSLILVAVLAIWAVFILPRVLREPLPELKSAELPQSAAFVKSVARPPSLYITVSAAEWGRMARADRQAYVESVALSAEAAGYTGVNIRSTDGKTVAQWLAKKGPRLID